MTNYIRFKRLHLEYVPVTRGTIWNWVHTGAFPSPIQLNPNVTGSPIVWSEDEIIAWLETRPRGFGPLLPSLDPVRRQAVRAQRKAQREAAKSSAERNSNGHNSPSFMGPTLRFHFVRRRAPR